MGIKTIPATEYVEKLLGNRDSITSADFPMENDFDFIMSMMIAAGYDSENSTYHLEFGAGEVKKNGYTIPNMTISKRI